MPEQHPEETLFVGRPAVVASLGGLVVTLLTLGIYALYTWWKSAGQSYKITTQRIVVEQGVFSKRLDQVDLYRVADYVVERPFGQRVMGTGNLVITTLEAGQSTLRIERIKTDVVALYEKLRQAVEAERIRRAVRLVDNESSGSDR